MTNIIYNMKMAPDEYWCIKEKTQSANVIEAYSKRNDWIEGFQLQALVSLLNGIEFKEEEVFWTLAYIFEELYPSDFALYPHDPERSYIYNVDIQIILEIIRNCSRAKIDGDLADFIQTVTKEWIRTFFCSIQNQRVN